MVNDIDPQFQLNAQSQSGLTHISGTGNCMNCTKKKHAYLVSYPGTRLMHTLKHIPENGKFLNFLQLLNYWVGGGGGTTQGLLVIYSGLFIYVMLHNFGMPALVVATRTARRTMCHDWAFKGCKVQPGFQFSPASENQLEFG